MDELTQAFHDAWRAVKAANEPRAKTGRYLNDPTPTINLPDGWIHVRKDDDIPFPARNINVRTDRSDIDVILQRLDDDSYQVLQADPIKAPEALGAAASDLNQPDSHGELLATALPNRLLKDLRLRLAQPSEGNALTVVLEAGIYEDASSDLVYVALQVLDLTSELPSSGMKVPVALGLDSSAALLPYSGTEVTIPTPPLVTPFFDLSTFYDLRDAATGADLWLWALALYDGQTGFQSTDDFIDLRPYLSLSGGGSGADSLGTYIVQTHASAPANAQVLDDLTAGIVKVEAGGALATAADGTDYYSPTTLPEAVQDIIGAALVAGTNITITYNDGANTITIAAGATPGGGAPPSICEGRLTLTSGTPATTSDVTAATTLYWTPFKGGYIAVYSGSAWVLFTPGELSISLSGLTANSNYDVFMNYNSGTPALELLIWTNATTRATALATQNGIYIKNGDATRRYLGTIRITGTTGQCEDSEAKRFVWNYYNRVPRRLYKSDTGANYTYATTTFRQARASSAQQVEWIEGVAEDTFLLTNTQRQSGATGAGIGIGINSTSVATKEAFFVASTSITLWVHYTVPPTLGYTYAARLEYANGATVTYLGGDTYAWITGILPC